MTRRRLLPSPAMVVACLALAVALGGTAFAAGVLPRNSVGTTQLVDEAVTSAKVRDGSLTRADFRSGQLAAGARGPVGPAGPAGAAGAAGPAGPSDALAVFHDGETLLSQTALTAIAKLPVPEPGRYVIWSKVYVANTKVVAVRCRLVAGSDTDDSLVNGHDFVWFTMTNLVVHTFTEPGEAELRCKNETGGDPRAYQAKIVAIRVGSLTNAAG